MQQMMHELTEPSNEDSCILMDIRFCNLNSIFDFLEERRNKTLE